MRLGLKDQALFFTNMATMLAAGVPLLKGLESVAKNSRSVSLSRFARSISEFVINGGRLSEAMEKLPGISDTFVINMVRVGEQGGFIDAKFREIAAFLDKVYSFRLKFLSGLIYPLLLFHAGVLLPPLFYFFINQPETYLKVTLSILIPFYVISIFTVMLYVTLHDIRGCRMLFDFFFAYVPLIAGVMRKLAISRFARGLANLYESGVGVVPSVKMAAQACGNLVLEGQLNRMGDMIDKGVPLSKAMEQTRLFHPTVLQLVSTGEESGETAKLLLKAAEYLDEQLDESVKRFFIILPIIFYLIMGVYVGYIFITRMLSLLKQFMF